MPESDEEHDPEKRWNSYLEGLQDRESTKDGRKLIFHKAKKRGASREVLQQMKAKFRKIAKAQAKPLKEAKLHAAAVVKANIAQAHTDTNTLTYDRTGTYTLTHKHTYRQRQHTHTHTHYHTYTHTYTHTHTRAITIYTHIRTHICRCLPVCALWPLLRVMYIHSLHIHTKTNLNTRTHEHTYTHIHTHTNTHTHTHTHTYTHTHTDT